MSWIVLIVLALLVLGIAYGLYTRQGSGISEHPLSDQPPSGAGEGGLDRPGIDEGESHELDQRGTDGG